MTLSLYLARHAKAENALGGGGDHARALDGRGRKEARQLGKFLARIQEAPALVLASTAARTRETAELVRDGGDFHAPLELRPEIYEAGPETLLHTVQSTGPSVERLLLVGHQPGLSLLIALLTGGEPDFPTCAAARIDFEFEQWSQLQVRSGALVWLVTPEVLRLAR